MEPQISLHSRSWNGRLGEPMHTSCRANDTGRADILLASAGERAAPNLGPERPVRRRTSVSSVELDRLRGSVVLRKPVRCVPRRGSTSNVLLLNSHRAGSSIPSPSRGPQGESQRAQRESGMWDGHSARCLLWTDRQSSGRLWIRAVRGESRGESPTTALASRDCGEGLG